MQRTLLVLVLVALALVALLFGVFHVLAEPEAPAGIETAGTRPAPARTADPSAGITQPRGDLARQGPASAATRELPTGTEGFAHDNRLAGTVVDEAARPVADAEVTLTEAWTDAIVFVNDEQDRSRDVVRRTDAEGRFVFADLTPRDQYRLIVVHPDYARREVLTVPVGPQGDFVEPPIVISSCAGLTGTVRDEGGQPIAGAALELDGSAYQHSPYAAPDRMIATTSGDGQFTFRHVPAGHRALTARAAGFGTLTINAIDFDCGESESRTVVLKRAERIAGKVVGPGDKGIPGASVLALGFNMTQHTARGTAVTNDAGEFSIEALMPGKYNLVANARGWKLRVKQVQSGTENVVLEGTEQAQACGRVVDAETGAPIASFDVRLRLSFEGNDLSQPMAESLTVVENVADGAFCIPGVQESSDGGYRVEARAAGYAPGFSAVFPVEQGRSVKGIEVRLGHGGTLSGRVVDGDGKPVARALVRTHDNGWVDDPFSQATRREDPTLCTDATARTDAQGRFTIPNLAPELYQITIEAGGFAAHEQKALAVVLGAENNVGDVRLGRGGTIRGRLLDAAGKPVAGGGVELRTFEDDRPRAYRAKSAADGTYTLSRIVPGRYTLVASRPDGGRDLPLGSGRPKTSERQIVVGEGDQLADVDLDLGP